MHKTVEAAILYLGTPVVTITTLFLPSPESRRMSQSALLFRLYIGM